MTSVTFETTCRRCGKLFDTLDPGNIVFCSKKCGKALPQTAEQAERFLQDAVDHIRNSAQHHLYATTATLLQARRDVRTAKLAAPARKGWTDSTGNYHKVGCDCGFCN